MRRANDLERLFQHRLRTLARAYDPYPTRRLRAELERYQFGALGNLPKFHARSLGEVKLRSVAVLYGVLFLGAAIGSLVLGL
jgi:hypothetical protein